MEMYLRIEADIIDAASKRVMSAHIYKFDLPKAFLGAMLHYATQYPPPDCMEPYIEETEKCLAEMKEIYKKIKDKERKEKAKRRAQEEDDDED